MKLQKAGTYLWHAQGIFFILLLLFSTSSFSQTPNLSIQPDTILIQPAGSSDTLMAPKDNNDIPGHLELVRGKLSIYPNPAHEHVQIAFSISSFGEYHQLTLLIFDIYGKTCKKENYSSEGNHITMDIGKLAQGTYIIILHDEWGRFMSEKLIVQ